MRGAWQAVALASVLLGLLAGGTPALSAPAATAPTHPTAAATDPPRSFGHVLGDVLAQRVLLQQAGLPVELAALPPADRVGLWLERRPAELETDDEGRRWLLLRYQVINAPRTLTAITLPALSLRGRAGETLAVAAWPLSIGPLTPPAVFGQGELQALRPDRAVAPLPTAADQRRLLGWLAASAAVALAWAAWWAGRNLLEKRRLPFARAGLELQRLRRAQPGLALEAAPAAWRALHHALNTAAGWAVQASSLHRLLAERPELRPLQPQLENFYRQSAQRFFAEGAVAEAPLLLALARALRQAERQHQP